MAILKNGLEENSKGITHACVLKSVDGTCKVISYHNNVHDAGVNAGITGGQVVLVRYEGDKPVLVLS